MQGGAPRGEGRKNTIDRGRRQVNMVKVCGVGLREFDKSVDNFVEGSLPITEVRSQIVGSPGRSGGGRGVHCGILVRPRFVVLSSKIEIHDKPHCVFQGSEGGVVDSVMYNGRCIQKLCWIQIKVVCIPNVKSMSIGGNRSTQNSA